jgi:hypothetical protein
LKLQALDPISRLSQSLGVGPTTTTPLGGSPKIGQNMESGAVARIVFQESVPSLSPKSVVLPGKAVKATDVESSATKRRKAAYGLFCERPNGCGGWI